MSGAVSHRRPSPSGQPDQPIELAIEEGCPPIDPLVLETAGKRRPAVVLHAVLAVGLVDRDAERSVRRDTDRVPRQLDCVERIADDAGDRDRSIPTAGGIRDETGELPGRR
jgi:hypothetical protein